MLNFARPGERDVLKFDEDFQGPLAGKTVNLGLLNASAGEAPDAAYWARIDIVSD